MRVPLLSLLTLLFLPILDSSAQQIRSNAASKSSTVELLGSQNDCDGCAWVQISGAIDSSTSAEVLDKLRRFGFVERVHIDSPGGDLLAALELGNALRELNVTTVVAGYTPDRSSSREGLALLKPGKCFSACVFILAGGTERLAIERSQIGVHRFRLSDSSGIDDPLALGQAQTGLLVAYVSKMGVDPLLVSYASMIEAEELASISLSDALELSLLTKKAGNAAALEATSRSEGGDPFGDTARVPPSDRSACQKPIVDAKSLPSYLSDKEDVATAGNRFWRRACNLYFDSPRTQAHWDIVYDAMKDLPTTEYISGLKFSTLEMQYEALSYRSSSSQIR